MSAMSGRTARIVGTTLIGLLWLLVLVLAGAASLELLLRIQSYVEERKQAEYADPAPRYERLSKAYYPFSVHHLHPQYFFFFPLDPGRRAALSNEICSVGADGFRGPGPAAAGGRRLAFLLGGSAAFGFYAGSDATTITAYLNQIQDEYFFVNAGVPAWNSTQELFRLAFEILDYHPALVVVYDGANDIALLEDYYRESSLTDTVGHPASFDVLAALVDDIDVGAGQGAAFSLASVFPELANRVNGRLGRAPRSAGEPSEPPAGFPEHELQAGAAQYLSNLTRMRNLATAEGARFIAVFQPISWLHQHVDPGFERDEVRREVFARFHQAVMARYSHAFEFHDLASVFDQYYAAVPARRGDITDETVFVDQVHLHDPGNQIVAKHLFRLIGH